MSITNYGENFMLDALPSPLFVKLHTGDPGEDATSNAAATTLRKSVAFAAASTGSRVTTADAEWTGLANAETITHVSLWDALTLGNPVWSGALTVSKTVAVGDDLKIASGSLAIALD